MMIILTTLTRNPRKKDTRNFYGSVPIKLGYSQGMEFSSKLDDKSLKE